MDSINYLLSIETRGIKLGFERTQAIMKTCNNPHIGLPVIQVVGTNGKGSVCAILASILQAAKYKTGLFTSPHLMHVNERIRINGKSIPDLEIDGFIQSYKQDIEKIQATFFETITALACWYFKKKNVDIAIMETGLGGRLDSTSICEPLVTVITPVSMDHMEILGETLREITVEKAGAMKKDVLCLSSHQKSEVSSALQSEAILRGTPLHFISGGKKENINVNIPGKKQIENTQLALSVLDNLNGYNIPNSAITEGLNMVKWHGRNQMLQENPIVIFDVAHNVDGLRCFLDYYRSLNIREKSTLVMALYLRKRIHEIVPMLEDSFQRIICTETEGRNPMPAEILGGHFSLGHSVEIIKDPLVAIRKGLDGLSSDGGMAILGTHCLGPAVNELFKISFDNL